MTITPRGGGPVVVAGTGHPINILLTGAWSPQAGDLVIAIHGNDYYALSNMNVPTIGGTAMTAILNASADAGNPNAHSVAYGFKVLASGDVTVQLTETGAHDEDKVGVVWVLPGADTTNWIDGGAAGAAGSFSATGQSSFVLTGVTPVGNDAFLIYHLNSGGGSSAGFPFTQPGGMTESYDAVTGGISYTGGYQQLSASGATGTRTIVSGAGSPSWSGLLLAVKTAAGGSPVTDPVAGGGSTAGQADGVALGDGSSGGSTAGAADGVALGTVAGGASSSGTQDGLALGDSAGGAGTGGTPDTFPVNVPDPGQAGAGTGGTPDVVSTGTQVVHDQMVMPLATMAYNCLAAEIAKLASPPAKLQMRPGRQFTALVDQVADECCAGIAYVRPGTQIPTSGHWPQPLTDVDGPSSSRGNPPYYAVTIELGIWRCIPTVSNVEGEEGQVPTAAQWQQALQDQLDDAAALRRAACCLRAQLGVDSVIAGNVEPLENQGNCGGVSMLVTLRATACDC